MALAREEDTARLRALLAVGPSVTYAVTAGLEPEFTFLGDNLLDRFGIDPSDLSDGPAAWYDLVADDCRDEALAALALARQGRPAKAEYRVLLPDGQWRWVRDERVALPSEAGTVQEYAGVWTDATESREQADTAPDAAASLLPVVESLPAPVAYVGADQRYLFANAAYAAWFGWPVEALRGVTVQEVLGEERYEWGRSHIESALRGDPTGFEGEGPDRGQGERYARVSYGPHVAADGSVLGYFVVITDLTALRQAQQALRASEGRLEGILDTAVDGIVTATEDGVIESLNAAAREMFGLAPGQGVGENVAVLMPPAESAGHSGAIHRYLSGGEGQFVGVGRVARGVRQNGTLFPVHISLSDATLPDGRRFTAIMRDMTEEVRLADELRELNLQLEQRVADRTAALAREVAERRDAEEGLRHVLAAARCILWRATVQDVDGAMHWDVTPVDEDAAQRFVPLDLSGGVAWHTASVRARFAGETARMADYVKSQLRAGATTYSQEFRLTDALGDVRWLQEDVIVERVAEGRWNLTGVALEVTQRKLAEEDLRRSEEHFRRIFDGSPIGVVIVDPHLDFVDVNPALCAMLGYTRAELLGMSMADITHEDDMDSSRAAAQRVGEQAGGAVQLEKRYRRKDGSAMWAQLTVAMLSDSAGDTVGRVGMIEDIEARRRSESLQEALHEIGEAVHVSADLHALVRAIGACVGRVMDAENFAVGLTNDDGTAFVRWIDLLTEHPVEPEALDRRRSGWVLRERRPQRLTREDTLRHIEAGSMSLPDENIGSWCGAPLVVDGRAIGIVRVRNDELPEAYDDDDMRFLDFIASQIALALSRKAAEQSLTQERRLFDELMENAPDSIYFKGVGGDFVRVSERDAQRMGLESARDMVGLSDFDFWPRDDAERLRAQEAEIMRSGRPMVGHVTRHPSEGEAAAWWSTTKVPLTDADGAAAGIIGIGRDVTTLMSAQEALRDSEAQRTRLMQQLLVVQEEERARIARELHDQVGQDLASVLIGLRIIGAAQDIETARSEATLLRDRAANTLEDVRQLAFDMRPSSLDDLGLMVALERALSHVAQESGFEPVLVAHGAPSQPMAPDVELGIYRVVHAAIANAALHATPATVSVIARFAERSVSILVEDDGCGFDVESVLAGPVEDRFGLLAMQERAQMFGGELTIDSTPGEGTVLLLDVAISPSTRRA